MPYDYMNHRKTILLDRLAQARHAEDQSWDFYQALIDKADHLIQREAKSDRRVARAEYKADQAQSRLDSERRLNHRIVTKREQADDQARAYWENVAYPAQVWLDNLRDMMTKSGLFSRQEIWGDEE